MMDQIFDWCVRFLIGLAHLTGTTYNEINVIIFCILWPIVTVALFAIIWRQRRKIRNLQDTLKFA